MSRKHQCSKNNNKINSKKREVIEATKSTHISTNKSYNSMITRMEAYQRKTEMKHKEMEKVTREKEDRELTFKPKLIESKFFTVSCKTVRFLLKQSQ